MDKIDPGPGYRLLEIGEEKPEKYDVLSQGVWEPGYAPHEVVREYHTPFRVKLPETLAQALDAGTPSTPEASGTVFSGTVEPSEAKILDNAVLDCHFLQWVADRLVHVHNDPENVDFVLRLRALAEKFPDLPKPFTPNKYTRDLLSLDGRRVPVDVYSVLAAFPSNNGAVDHALKKLLAPGQRGQKDRLQDLKEARASLDRAIQMEGG